MPKPLKFLRPHFATIKEMHGKIEVKGTKVSSLVRPWSHLSADAGNGGIQEIASDVVSLLAMTQEEGRDTLNYRFTGTDDPIESWGHEYVRYVF